MAFHKFICSRDESALNLACASESPFSGKLKLAASLGEISAAFAASKSSKASAAATELLDKAPGAVVKLKAKGGEVQCLTVAEIFAVALRYFNTASS